MTIPFRSRLPGGWPEDAPPRSILFSLAPYGCSGEDRESLGSYITRLCEAHGMTRGTLTSTIIGPAAQMLLGVQSARMTRDIGRADYNVNVSSLTEQSNPWTHILNYLTHRNNLQVCTLLPLRNLVSAFVLLSDKQRFCPGCHEDDALAERERYDRLLWSIAAVKACPLHRLQLLNRSRAKPRTVSNGEGNTSSHEAETPRKVTKEAKHTPASDFEVESSRLIAELLDDAVAFADVGYSASSQSAFLIHAIDVLFQGTAAHFAAHLGVSKSQMHGWVNGKVRMSFPRLMLTAYCCGCGCGCAIADILLGNRVMLSLRPAPHGHRRRLIKHCRRGALRPREDLRAELDTLIHSGHATNATEAAQTIGVSMKYLRKKFPQHHGFLVRHGRELVYSARNRATATFDQIYLREHNALFQAGVYPLRRRVVERMQGKTRIGGRSEVQSAQRKAHAQTGIHFSRLGSGRMATSPNRGQSERRV